jgi:hypothetical protein
LVKTCGLLTLEANGSTLESSRVLRVSRDLSVLRVLSVPLDPLVLPALLDLRVTRVTPVPRAQMALPVPQVLRVLSV